MNYYEILEVSSGATPGQIREARNRLVLEYHPDRIPEHLERLRNEARAKTTLINEAYAVLSDASKRVEYDRGLGFQPQKPSRERHEPTARSKKPQYDRSTAARPPRKKETPSTVQKIKAPRSPGRQLFVAALGGLALYVIWQVAFLPILREQARQEEERESTRAKRQAFALSWERPRTTARLEPRETSPVIVEPDHSDWWGYDAISACVSIELNSLFVKEWCPGDDLGLRDIAGDTEWRTLKFTAHDKPVDIALYADFTRESVSLSRDSSALNIIVTPGTYLEVHGRPDPRRLSWTPLENCVIVAYKGQKGHVVKSCPGDTYSFYDHFKAKRFRYVYYRAMERPARISLEARF